MEKALKKMIMKKCGFNSSFLSSSAVKHLKHYRSQLAANNYITCLLFALCLFFPLGAQSQESETEAPVVQTLLVEPNSVIKSNSVQQLTVHIQVVDQSLVTIESVLIENLATGQQINLEQMSDWQNARDIHSVSYSTNIDLTTETGVWFVKISSVVDEHGNNTDQYNTIESFVSGGLNPFISIAPSDANLLFDASLQANSGFNLVGSTQTSSLNMLLEDAQDYVLWLIPNATTDITQVSFSDVISIAQSCSEENRIFLCAINASNNNESFLVNVTSSASNINDFGYKVYIQPDPSSSDANWLNNFVVFPIQDFDNDGMPNEQDLDDDNDQVSDLNDLFPFDASETLDADLDGIGDNADSDDDNDGVDDSQDAFPFDPLENNDNDGDGQGDVSDTDDDNDGVLDSRDAFPFDENESLDTDADGIGNNADNDDDNDGGLDENDAFPLDPTETIDSDGDGIGNNADLDDDNDGTPDVLDPFPRDPNEDTDTDEDGVGNNADEDDDNDGVRDVDDVFPLDPGDFRDNDQDGIGDNTDNDDDNDGILDFEDAFQFNASESVDTDGDGIGNNADQDDDNDGLDDEFDRFPLDASEISDFDGDGIGNNADTDDDNDGVLDTVDAFPFAVTEWFDTDGDGIGNNADPDNDNDGVDDEFDAFDNDASETIDTDGDAIGNNADTDDDNDGTPDISDAFPLDDSEDTDTDRDGIGNNTDTDDDNDRVLDEEDLFPLDANESSDNDLDGIGNNADTDDDNDDVLDINDAFPFDASESQDNDIDGIGDNADADDDNDGIEDANDVFPFDSSEWADNDADNLGDNRDADDDNDGVLDTLDVFPFDATESQDFDMDGIGNNADTDDDNDGVLDDVDAFPFASDESIDSDGDGIGNNADVDDDNDGIVDQDDSQPLNPTIGDNEAPILDGIEDILIEATGPLTDIALDEPRVRDNNLNPAQLSNDYNGALPLGTHIITWTAVDFAGNTTELTQTIVIEDTTAPEFPSLDTISIDARGILTDVSKDLNIFAFDAVDGEVSTTILTENNLKSGLQSVIVQAEDRSGNRSIHEVFLNIQPSFVMKARSIAAPGNRIRLPIGLSGKAANYPVQVSYQVVGPVTSELSSVLSIEQGQSSEIVIDISPTAVLGEQVIVSFSNPINASIGRVSQLIVDIDNDNQAPTADLKLVQNDNVVTLAYQNEGISKLQLNINDINVDDIYAIEWQVFAINSEDIGPQVADIDNDASDTTFEFFPEQLAPGRYLAKVNITETNTFERFNLALESTFAVASGSPEFSEQRDSDFDGISDAQEGVLDEDLDGIPDYLDNEANQALLPTGASEQALTTIDGLRLTVGDIAKRANTQNVTSASISRNDIATYGAVDGGDTSLAADIHYNAVQEIQNFNVEGLDIAGQSVPVVIPLNTGTVIPEQAIYRKYNSREGWFTFVENAHNAILSASYDAEGNCPEPESTMYLSGLAAGNTCILLIIQDGGPNDGDLLANGIVKDPGVLAVQLPNSSPRINVAQELTVLEGELVRVDASLTSDVEDDELTFKWTQLAGLRVSIGENSSPLLSFTAPQVSENESMLFRLEVFDGRDTSSVDVRVYIRNQNTPPSVSIDLANSSVNENQQITLVANAKDADGDTLRYSWSQVSGPAITLTNTNSAQLSFTAPSVETNQSVVISVSVFDGSKEVGASATIIINNTDPAESNANSDNDSGGGAFSIYLLLLTLLTVGIRKHEQTP